jgi:hypothetical protein
VAGPARRRARRARLLALRNARPQARYAVACFALAVCLALPLAGLWRGVAGAAPAHDEAAASVTATWLATPVAADTAPAAPASDWRQSLQAQMPAIVAAWSAGALLLALRLLLRMPLGRPPARFGTTAQQFVAGPLRRTGGARGPARAGAAAHQRQHRFAGRRLAGGGRWCWCRPPCWPACRSN